MGIHGGFNGNNRFLDEKVEQLSSLDSYIAWQKGYTELYYIIVVLFILLSWIVSDLTNPKM
jgi:hypothetical protein